MVVDKYRALHQHLRLFKPEELQLFDEENVEWLPRLRSIHPSYIVQHIISAVRAFETEAERLQRTAWIRCWLMPFDNQLTWALYSAAKIPALHECTEALTRMASLLKRITEDASEAPQACIVRGSAVYACLMAEVELNQPVERYAVYVCMWTTQPLLAVNCACRIAQRIQYILQIAIRSDLQRIGEVRGSPEVAWKTALSTLSKFPAEPKGQRYPTADQQPRETLAVGSHVEQLSSVLGRT
ncbi:hypothetical protein V5799_003656, partial [Amblyomma americanum]